MFRLQRLVKDLLKQLQGQDSGQWANNKVSGLDRTLGEISRILEKQVWITQTNKPMECAHWTFLPFFFPTSVSVIIIIKLSRCKHSVHVLLCRQQRPRRPAAGRAGRASPLACLLSDEFCLAASPPASRPPGAEYRLRPTDFLAFGYWLMKTRLAVFSLCTWYQ